MDLKAASTIQLCLAKEVMYNMTDEEMTTGLWFTDIVYNKKPLQHAIS